MLIIDILIIYIYRLIFIEPFSAGSLGIVPDRWKSMARSPGFQSGIASIHPDSMKHLPSQTRVGANKEPVKTHAKLHFVQVLTQLLFAHNVVFKIEND